MDTPVERDDSRRFGYNCCRLRGAAGRFVDELPEKFGTQNVSRANWTESTMVTKEMRFGKTTTFRWFQQMRKFTTCIWCHLQLGVNEKSRRSMVKWKKVTTRITQGWRLAKWSLRWTKNLGDFDPKILKPEEDMDVLSLGVEIEMEYSRW